MELEHYWKDSTTDDGKHLMGSGKGWVTNTEPTNAPSGEALDATDTGQFWFNDSNGALTIYTGANFIYPSYFDTNVNITGILTVAGALTVTSNVEITGSTTVAGAVTVTSNVDITGTLTVAGAVDFDSNLNVAGTLTVAGTTDITSALNVTGSGTFDGGIDAGSSGTALKCKIVNIGDWNMDTTSSVTVAHGLGASWSNIRHVGLVLRNDANDTIYPSSNVTGASNPAVYVVECDSTNVQINRATSGFFDTTDFNSTSYNRGWLVIWYEA
jgi:cytoskeletal protein CcmA (bactofilin family)